MGVLPKWLTPKWLVWTAFKVFGFPYMMVLILLMMMQRCVHLVRDLAGVNSLDLTHTSQLWADGSTV